MAESECLGSTWFLVVGEKGLIPVRFGGKGRAVRVQGVVVGIVALEVMPGGSIGLFEDGVVGVLIGARDGDINVEKTDEAARLLENDVEAFGTGFCKDSTD